ncbi:MAG: methyl-accepting chemotaxis protein [SAR324 cluster bacterium]|nr:methyl-accepting chemotaxis protein [SAR324 cluster bacterium]
MPQEKAATGFKNFFRIIRQSIRLKLMFSLGIFTLFILLVIGAYSLQNSTATLRDAMVRELLGKVEQESVLVLNLLKTVESDLMFLTQTPPIQGMIRASQNLNIDPLDGSSTAVWKSRLETIFENFALHKKHYRQIRFIGKDGHEQVRVDFQDGVVKTTPPERLQDKSKSGYFSKTASLEKHEFYISPLELNMEQGVIERPFLPVIRYATPVYDHENQFAGIVILNVFGEFLREILNKDNQHVSYLVNKDGYFLAHPDPAKEWGFALKHEHRIQNDFPEEAGTLLSGKPGFLEREDRLSVFFPLQVSSRFGVEWTFIVDANSDQIFLPIQSFQFGLMGVAGAILILSLLGAYFLAEKFTLPIRKAVEITNQLSQGDLSISIDVKSIDEIGQLLMAMQTMQSHWNQILGNIRDGAMQLTSSTNQISASSTEQSRNIEEQNDAITNFSAGLNELSATSNEMNLSADRVVESANQAIELASQGNKAIVISLNSIEEISSSNSNTSEKFTVLTEKVENIAKVMGTITKIADKTNLLSVNASIEAVKAGEFGKGFSVVASEIRRLADQTVLASEEISELINEIQKAANAAMMSMEKSSATTREGTRQINEAGDSIQALIDAVQEIGPMLVEMKVATEQQMDSARQMTDSIKQIQQMSNENKINAEQISETSIPLTHMAQDQLEIVQQFKVSTQLPLLSGKEEAEQNRLLKD